jgi:hypothetical protein
VNKNQWQKNSTSVDDVHEGIDGEEVVAWRPETP